MPRGARLSADGRLRYRRDGGDAGGGDGGDTTDGGAYGDDDAGVEVVAGPPVERVVLATGFAYRRVARAPWFLFVFPSSFVTPDQRLASRSRRVAGVKAARSFGLDSRGSQLSVSRRGAARHALPRPAIRDAALRARRFASRNLTAAAATTRIPPKAGGVCSR